MMGRHHLKRLGVLLMMVTMMVSLSSTTALAKKNKKEAAASKDDGARIDAVLGDLKWGDSKTKVLDYIRDQRLDALKEDKALKKDRVKMQAMRKRVLEWHDTVEKSYTRFSGKEGAEYEVSLVSGHYTKNNGESMLLARDKVAQRFFFFIDGQLYKIVVAYDQDYVKDVGFEAFVGQSAKKYGRPVSVEYGELYGEDELIRVTWNDSTSILELENQREFFGTYSMVFSDRKRIKELTDSKRTFGGAGKEVDDTVSSEVASLTRDDGGDNSDVLNSLVGNIEIEKDKGRPKDAIKVPEEKDEDKGGDDKASKSKKSKKSKKSARPKAKKKKSGTDLKNIDAGDEELIIY